MKRWTAAKSATWFVLGVTMTIVALALLGGSASEVVAAPDVQLAVAHLAPFASDSGTAVNVTVNGMPIPALQNIAYGDSSEGYLSLPVGGSYEVGIVPVGSMTPVLTKTVMLTDGKSYTAVAVGGANDQPLDLMLLTDDNTPPLEGSAKVRIGHLAPFASVMTDTLADVRHQDGTLILNDVPYGVVAGYLTLPAGEYDLKITDAENTTTLIDLYPVTLNSGDILSVFATGDGANQPLGAFAMTNSEADGFLPLAASLQIGHLAPFAMGMGTSVSVTVESTAVLTDFMFADSTGYLPIMAGVDQEVGIVPAGSTEPVLTATVNLAQANDYTALAIGDIANQPLALELLEDDNTPPMMGFAKVRIGHLAPFAETITDTVADVRTQCGEVVADDVAFGDISDYVLLPGGQMYDLKITTPDGSVTLIDIMPVTLNAGDILSVFAVGNGAEQPLGVFALPAGEEGMLLPLAASLQVAHLAPLSSTPATAVGVTLDGTPVLTDVVYGMSTGYLPVQAGVDHEVGIVPMGAMEPVLTATINLTHAQGFAAVAHGGANTWDLELMLLEDDPTPPMPGYAKVRIGHLAPFAETITDTLADIRTQDGALVNPALDDVPYGGVSGYLQLPAATYDLKITNADGAMTLIDPFPVTLNDGDIVSVLAVGDGMNQPVGVYALPLGQPGAMLPLAKISYFPRLFKILP